MAEIPSFPHFLAHSSQEKSGIITRTQQPIVTGSSVIALKYNGGVMLASDTLGSYGSLAKFRSIKRMQPVGEDTIVGASGEFSDFTYIMKILDQQTTKDYNLDDGHKLTPKEIHQYLVRTMHNRRNKFDPLWNTLVVGGFQNGKPFLGLVDSVGTHFEDNTIATGYGAYIAQPILRNFYAEKGSYENINEAEAKQVLETCMKVLFYRDARTSDKIQMSIIDDKGARVLDPYYLQTQWSFKGF